MVSNRTKPIVVVGVGCVGAIVIAVSLYMVSVALLAAGLVAAVRTRGPQPGGWRPPETIASVTSQGELLFADVDGDGSDDVLLWSVNRRGQRMVAMSGADGRRLWEHDIPYPSGGVTLAGRLLLVATDRPSLEMFDVASGAPLGVVPLRRRVQRVCDESALRVRVVESEDVHELVDLRTGRVETVERGACPAPLPSTDAYDDGRSPAFRGGYRAAGGRSRSRGRFASSREGAPWIVLHRQRDAAPELVAETADGSTRLWRTPITQIDPTRLMRDEPYLSTDGDLIVATYRTETEWRASAFAMQDGARRWDVAAAPGRARPHVFVRGPRVYQRVVGGFVVLDASDGRRLAGPDPAR